MTDFVAEFDSMADGHDDVVVLSICHNNKCTNECEEKKEWDVFHIALILTTHFKDTGSGWSKMIKDLSFGYCTS
jgi:hypothetical protein